MDRHCAAAGRRTPARLDCSGTDAACRKTWLATCAQVAGRKRVPAGHLPCLELAGSAAECVDISPAVGWAMPLLKGGRPHSEDEGHATQGAGVDDYQGLRVYQPGDNRNRLHWKAYSRGQGLLVKDFTDLSGHDVCLDFMALGGNIEDRLSRLCYWVLELSRRCQPFALRLPGFLSTMGSGDAHREACLRALALYGYRS
ncbi:hypothetical protein ALQ50_101521 [Pseudomonas coronafaciens pv. coronafaciens]|nr:hypothetical protein ALQ50_101521 [Pseudomonas coronafaciens pv. coronafaciens]